MFNYCSSWLFRCFVTFWEKKKKWWGSIMGKLQPHGFPVLNCRSELIRDVVASNKIPSACEHVWRSWGIGRPWRASRWGRTREISMSINMGFSLSYGILTTRELGWAQKKWVSGEGGRRKMEQATPIRASIHERTRVVKERAICASVSFPFFPLTLVLCSPQFARCQNFKTRQIPRIYWCETLALQPTRKRDFFIKQTIEA